MYYSLSGGSYKSQIFTFFRIKKNRILIIFGVFLFRLMTKIINSTFFCLFLSINQLFYLVSRNNNEYSSANCLFSLVCVIHFKWTSYNMIWTSYYPFHWMHYCVGRQLEWKDPFFFNVDPNPVQCNKHIYFFIYIYSEHLECSRPAYIYRRMLVVVTLLKKYQWKDTEYP